MTISKENEWLSQTESANSKTAILIGEIELEQLIREIDFFPKGILIIGKYSDDTSNVTDLLKLLSVNQDNESLLQEIQSFIRLDQDNIPTIKVGHIKNHKMADRFLEIIEIVKSVIDSTVRARKTRKETGFLRQKNIFNNLNYYLNERVPNEWKNYSKGSIAVVIGAGPSLDATLHLLSKLDNPLIICTDSGLSSLRESTLSPHFVINLDPEKTFDQCTDSSFTPGTLILSSQSHDSWNINWNGTVRFISGRVVTEDWLSEKGVGKTTAIAENNVGLTAISFANYLGPSAIILFGMDLSCGGNGEKRYAEVTGRQNIEVNTSFYHKIPGNYCETVPTPFFSDWQETSKKCLEISKNTLLININDRGAQLEGTNLLHPKDFVELLESFEDNFKPFAFESEIFEKKRKLNQLAKNQICYELARICDKVWTSINGNSEDVIDKIRILLGEKDTAALLGDFSFYAFQILLSENRINDEKGFQIKSELTKLIWRLEDAILEIKPSDEFVKDFLTAEIFT